MSTNLLKYINIAKEVAIMERMISNVIAKSFFCNLDNELIILII